MASAVPICPGRVGWRITQRGSMSAGRVRKGSLRRPGIRLDILLAFRHVASRMMSVRSPSAVGLKFSGETSLASGSGKRTALASGNSRGMLSPRIPTPFFLA